MIMILIMIREPSRLARWLVRAVSTLFYRVERAGPALPSGSVLLLVNHPNALLDAAVVWATAGRDLHFLAKSTLFAIPGFGWLLRWGGAIPTYRRIDPGVDASRNVEMFAAAGRVLDRGGAVCLFPEGVSHAGGRLEPLRTGAARIALEAATRGVHVALVPVGLNFERRWAFRSRVTVVYGAAFFATSEAGEPLDLAPETVRRLTDLMAKRLRKLVVEADPLTDAEIVRRIDRLYTAARAVSRAPGDRVQRRRAIAAGIERLRTTDSARYEAIRERVQTYDARLRRFGLRDRDLDWRVAPATALRFALRETALLLVLSPLVAAGLVVFAVPYVVTNLVTRSIGPEPDVAATTKMIVGAAVHAAWTLGIATAAWALADWRWALALVALLPVLAVAALLAFERESAVAATVRAWLAVTRARERTRRHLARRRAEIADVLDATRAWLERNGQSRS